MIILFLVLFVSTAQAAEVCTDRTEFISVMSICQIDKKQNALYKQKDQAQAKIIKELKDALRDSKELSTKKDEALQAADQLIAEYASQREALIQENKEKEYSAWMERGKGFGAGVALAVLWMIVK